MDPTLDQRQAQRQLTRDQLLAELGNPPSHIALAEISSKAALSIALEQFDEGRHEPDRAHTRFLLPFHRRWPQERAFLASNVMGTDHDYLALGRGRELLEALQEP